MEYEKKLVSVVVPTYKRSDMLMRCIDSILGQSYRNIELIIVNDNTIGDEFSQKLYKVIESYNDERLVFIEQEKHINGAVARNVGIRAAKGEYIAFNDDDDYWEPQKIERQVKILSQLDKTWGAVSCLMRLYNNGKLIESTLPYRDGMILLDILDRKTSMGTGALLIRREALDDVGYFDEALLRHQDLQLFACLTAKYKIKLDREYLHNREVKDTQNRINADKMILVKKEYFNSINNILINLSKKDRQTVTVMHNFELSFHLMQAGRKKEAVKYALPVLKMPRTAWLAMERVMRRTIQKRFCRVLEKKYTLE